MSAASASGTRRIVGESAVIAIRASVTVPPVDGDDGRRADDGDLHLAPVLEPEVGAARAVGRSGKLDPTSSSSASAVVAPGPVQRSSIATSREPERDCSVAVAPKQTSGPPVSIAGEAFITLPPIVPCARVAWEPTIAQASASAVKRARTSSFAAISRWLARAPRRRPPSPSDSTPCSAAIRWIATMLSGSGDLPERAPTTRSVPPATGRAPAASAARASSTVRGACVKHAPLIAPASHTRSGVIGSLCTRAPITLAIAFATAPAVGTHGGSPTPFEPFGPAFGVSVSIQAMSIRGASDAVTSL